MSGILDRSLDEILAERKQVCGTVFCDSTIFRLLTESFNRPAEVRAALEEVAAATTAVAVAKDKTTPATVLERCVDPVALYPSPSASIPRFSLITMRWICNLHKTQA